MGANVDISGITELSVSTEYRKKMDFLQFYFRVNVANLKC